MLRRRENRASELVLLPRWRMAWNAEVANLMVVELGRYDDDTHVIGHRSEEARRDGEGRTSAFPQLRWSGGEGRVISLKESGCEQEGMVGR